MLRKKVVAPLPLLPSACVVILWGSLRLDKVPLCTCFRKPRKFWALPLRQGSIFGCLLDRGNRMCQCIQTHLLRAYAYSEATSQAAQTRVTVDSTEWQQPSKAVLLPAFTFFRSSFNLALGGIICAIVFPRALNQECRLSELPSSGGPISAAILQIHCSPASDRRSSALTPA